MQVFHLGSDSGRIQPSCRGQSMSLHPERASLRQLLELREATKTLFDLVLPSEIEIQLKCLRGELKFPDYFDNQTIDLLKWILKVNPSSRPTIEEIKVRIAELN